MVSGSLEDALCDRGGGVIVGAPPRFALLLLAAEIGSVVPGREMQKGISGLLWQMASPQEGTRNPLKLLRVSRPNRHLKLVSGFMVL